MLNYLLDMGTLVVYDVGTVLGLLYNLLIVAPFEFFNGHSRTP
jgi:hypothetical protein